MARVGFDLVATSRTTRTPLRAYADNLDLIPEFDDPLFQDADEQNAFQALHDRIRDDGFTSEERSDLEELGFDEADIDDVREQFDVDLMRLTPGATFQAGLREVADRIEPNRLAIDRFARAAEAVAGATDQEPVPAFSAAPISASDPLAMRFVDQSTSPDHDVIESVSWDFGDGVSGEGAQADHTYVSAGEYDVTETVCDHFACASHTKKVNVGVQNAAPSAQDDAVTMPFQTEASVGVLANDSDPDGDELTVASSTQGAHGTVSCEPAGDCTYTPEDGFSGSDSFTYTIADGKGGEDTASVAVTVEAAPPANRDPVAVDDSATTVENHAVEVDVLANDSDEDLDPLSVTTQSPVAENGTVACTSSGTCTYTPAAGFTGGDSFTYTIADGRGGVDSATVQVAVLASELGGKLEVRKIVAPSTDNGRFDLKIDGVTEKADAQNGDSTGEQALGPGVHAVGEAAGTDTQLQAYSSTIECRDDDGAGAVVAEAPTSGPMGVTVNSGDDIVCTITNTRRARLTVVKQVVNNDRGTQDAGDFSLHVTTGAFGDDVDGSPQAGSEGGSTYSLDPGTYSVSEDAVPRYTASFSGDCAADGTVTLQPEDDKTCTITNNDVAPPPGAAVLEGYDPARTDSDWGLTESFLSTTRAYVEDPANFGPGGVVARGYQVGTGIDAASAEKLAGVDVFFTGWVHSASYSTEEKAALREFVLAGGSVIATTDDTDHSMVDLFGLTQEDASGEPTLNKISNPEHPIADGPFGTVTDYNQYFATGYYSSLGPDAVALGGQVDGTGEPSEDRTTLAVIEPGKLGPGSGPVVFVADIDVFSDQGGATFNEKLIKNIFAYVIPPKPTLKVIKRVVNDDGRTKNASDFNLHVMTGGSDVASSPRPGNESGTTYALEPGTTYTVSENEVAGYAPSFSGDCAGDGTITLERRDAKACTVTNDDAVSPAPGSCLSYDDFSPPRNLSLLSGAAAMGDALRLTPAENNRQGQAWFGAKVPVADGFETQFRFQFTDARGHGDDDGSGADGITFAIQNESVLAAGIEGGSLGYQRLPNSLVTELDTFNNELGYGDPNGNHVAVHSRGPAPNGPGAEDDSLLGVAELEDQAGNPSPLLQDGNVHRARIAYDPGGTLSIYVDDRPLPVLTVQVDLATKLALDNGKAFVGFTAATGSGVENHDILDWTFCPSAPELTVKKKVVNNDGGTKTAGDFNLHVKAGGSDVAHSPQAGDESGTTYTLDPNTTYVVSEDSVSGYAGTMSGDCAANGTITLSPGEHRTCTITNDDVAPPPKAVGAAGVTLPALVTGLPQLIVGGCLNDDAAISGKRLGPAALGRGRSAQRAIFKGANLRGERDLDIYCSVGGGNFRIGYPTKRLNRTMPRSLRAKVRERVVLILTSSPRFSLVGVRPGQSAVTALRRIRGERGYKVGVNTWYVLLRRGGRLLVKVHGGKVEEIGIGDARLTRGATATKRFLRAWQLR